MGDIEARLSELDRDLQLFKRFVLKKATGSDLTSEYDSEMEEERMEQVRQLYGLYGRGGGKRTRKSKRKKSSGKQKRRRRSSRTRRRAR